MEKEERRGQETHTQRREELSI